MSPPDVKLHLTHGNFMVLLSFSLIYSMRLWPGSFFFFPHSIRRRERIRIQMVRGRPGLVYSSYRLPFGWMFTFQFWVFLCPHPDPLHPYRPDGTLGFEEGTTGDYFHPVSLADRKSHASPLKIKAMRLYSPSQFLSPKGPYGRKIMSPFLTIYGGFLVRGEFSGVSYRKMHRPADPSKTWPLSSHLGPTEGSEVFLRMSDFVQ